MANYLKNIDRTDFSMNQEVDYSVDGWIYFPKGEEFQLKLLGDGTEEISCDISWHVRKDLNEIYEFIPLESEAGFTVCIADVLERAKNYAKIGLYVCYQAKEEVLFEKEIKNLKQELSQNSIAYHIEQVDLWGGQMLIRGWVYDWYQSQDVKIQLVDEHDQPVKHNVNRVVRPDVNQHFELQCVDCQTGFHLSIQKDEIKAKQLRICFSTAYGCREYSINMRRFNLKHSKVGRLRTALKDTETKQKVVEGDGWAAYCRYLKHQMNPNCVGYNAWIRENSVSSKQLAAQRKTHFEQEPLVSILIPLYNTPLNYLKVLMDSLVQQSYKNIEICLADGSTNPEVGAFIRKKYGHDKRVVYKKLDENKGISENTNRALEMATGEFIMLSDHDDLVTRDAVYEIVKAINEHDDVDVVYTDEDKVTMDGKDYFEPSMKPDFNLDFLRSSNYICHIFVARKTIFDKIGGFCSEFDGAQDFDLILRCCEQARNIVHVPKVLYHWRSHPASTAGNPESKMYAFEAGRRALEEHYKRVGLDAKAELTNLFGRYRSVFPVHGEPKVSIIIPNKDHVDDLKLCVESILDKSTYKNYEILIVENNSTERETFDFYETLPKKDNRIKVITWADEFNYAAINNYAVKHTDGEYLLFLNNDTEIITENWLEEMLGYCQREDVGAVGAKLYFPDDTVQHAGVVIGMGGIAGHIFSGTPKAEYGYQARLISAQDISAVTAACLMVKRSVFSEIEGFDERYKVAFNDVDLCMKIRAIDQLIVFTPYVELYHYESKSRGKEETEAQLKRFHSEVALFEEKWPEILKNGDPYYSVNLSLDDGNCNLRTMK